MRTPKWIKKIGHYADPRTHVAAVRSAVKHTVTVQKRVLNFNRRVVSGENLKNIGRRVSVYESMIAPYLTAAVSFVVSIFFTPLAGEAVAGASAGIARYKGATAARAEGKHGADARREGAKLRNKVFELGSLGSTAGALTSVAIGALATAPTVAAGVSEAVPTNVVQLSGDAVPQLLAGPSIEPLAASGAAPSVTGGGDSLLGSVWSGTKAVAGGVYDVGKAVIPFAAQIAPTIMKLLNPAPPAKDAKASGGGGAGDGGAAGTGDVGTLGGIADGIAGLPLVVKLGAAAAGAGLIYVALRKKGRAA